MTTLFFRGDLPDDPARPPGVLSTDFANPQNWADSPTSNLKRGPVPGAGDTIEVGGATITGSGTVNTARFENYGNPNQSAGSVLFSGLSLTDQTGYVDKTSGAVLQNGASWTNAASLDTSGDIEIDKTSTLKDGGKDTVETGGMINVAGQYTAGGGLTLNGSVTATAGGTVSITGSASGSGSLSANGGTATANSADIDSLVAGAGGSLTIGGAATTRALSVNGGGSLTVSGLTFASAFVSGAGSVLTDSGALAASGKTDSSISVSQGGTFAYSGGALTLRGIDITLNGAGSTLGFSGALTVGSGGNGSLSVNGGSYTAAGDVPLGVGAGDFGSLGASGSGSVLRVNGVVTVGVAGSGNIGANGGGTVSAKGLVLSEAASAGSTNPGIGNQLFASSGGRISVDNDVVLGDAGVASATLRGGTVTVGGDTTLGMAATAFGEIFATGAGSRWNDAGTITVGVAGQAILKILGGAEVDAASVVVGDSAQGSSVMVQGAGSKLIVSGDLIQKDKDSVSVTGGATLSVGGALTTATGAGSTLLTVDGAGSTDIVGGKTDFSSGKDGTFTFALGDGALFDGKGAVEIGDQGSATVNVDGSGTSFDAESNLSLDAAGQGNLALTNAASLTVGGDLRAGTANGGKASFSLSDASKAVVKGLADLGDAVGATVQVALFTAAELVVGHSLQIAQNGSVVVDGEGMLTHIEADQDVMLAGKGTGEIDLKAGATLTDKGDFVAGIAQGGKAILNLTGSGTKAAIDGIATFGDAVGATVQVLLFDTAQLVTGKSLVIAQDGSVVVNGEGMLTTIEADQDVMLAGKGTGEIDLKAGAVLTDKGDFTAGIAQGGKAILNLTGSATKATIGGIATLGDAVGTTVQAFIFDAAQLAIGGAFKIARAGNAVVDGEGRLTHIQADDDVVLADAGMGTLDLKDGATFSGAKDFSAGTGSGSATLAIDGDGSKATISGVADLATAAAATVKATLSAGAQWLVAKALTIGDQGSATVSATGANSTLAASDTATIGATGKGTLDVANGASFTAASHLDLGQKAAGDGTIVADGKGSSLTVSDATIGDAGHGRLDLSGGATFIVQNDGTIGAQDGSNGTLTATGDGTLAMFNDLIVGRAGAVAMLQLDAGASLDIASAFTVDQGATVDISGALSHATATTMAVKGKGDGVAGGGLVSVGQGGTLSVSQSLSLSAGGSLDVTGALAIGGGSAVAGTLGIGKGGTLTGDGTVKAGTISVAGILDATGGTLDVRGALSGDDGTAQVDGGGTLDLSHGADGTVGTLALTELGSLALGGTDLTVVHDFTDTLFGTGNSFDGRQDVTGAGRVIGKDAHLSVVGAGVSGGDGTAPTLTFTDAGNGTQTASFKIENSGSGATIRGAVQTKGLSAAVSGVTAGNFTLKAGEDGQTYTLTYDPSRGSLSGQTIRIVSNFDNVQPITLTLAAAETSPPCFARGTMILTDRGEVPVEALAVGDRLPTRGGAVRPIQWIGTRAVDVAAHPDAAPLRVRTGALGRGLPARDLYLSPDHAVFFEGVLIPVRCLVDGHGVARAATERVTYFHVELPSHDVIFADGLPVESFLDAGDKDGFGSMAVRDAALLWEGAGYAPLVMTGPILDRARAVLARRWRAMARKRGRQPLPAAAV